MSRIRSLRTPMLMLAIGLPLLFAIATLKPKPQPQPLAPAAPLAIQVSYAEPQEWRLQAQSQGTVEPKRDINLVAEVSGRIIEVSPKFVSGGNFKAGETLVKIDDRDYHFALIRAQARVADARQLLASEQGRARQAKREWRDLGNQQANDLFLRKPQLASAQANLQAALADQQLAELNLSRTNITLPFTGRVRQTLVNLGQYLTPGTPIASAYDSSIAEIRLSLTESQAALIELPRNHSPAAQLPQVILTGSVAGQPHQWQGRLTRTEASIDTRTRLYYTIAEVDDPYGASPPLMMGLFVDATIEGKPLQQVIRIPKPGLYQSAHVYAIDEHNRVQIKPVKVLSSNADFAWVQGELRQGEAIALEKQHYLKSGMQVAIKPAREQ
ncbi:MAG: efflux RND transporter periplasmic adaptor subunit [Candidatus Pelagadaptatus aseana]|uniref:efflux RND transporter periplasmic adaptor subunit n=1 Tax=Candidatus Pelagadaptatus aseana TaxID=3120508 RepID=UPI0039B12F7A